MSTEAAQLPVYTVQGANWTTNVAMDPFNAQFARDQQLMEAASRAIEVVLGIKVKGQTVNPHNLEIKLDVGETKHGLGTFILVFDKDGDPNSGEIYPTHVVLANGGFYKESIPMAEQWRNEVKAIWKEQQEQDSKHEAELRNFEKLQRELSKGKVKQQDKKPKRAPRKKKSPPSDSKQ